VRATLLDDLALLRAVASGRRRGAPPPWRRVELRYVDLKAGRHLQVTAYDATSAHIGNHLAGAPAAEAVDELLAAPFGNWHVETLTETTQLRVTKKLDAMVHTARRADPVPDDQQSRGHDRRKPRLLAEDDPVLRAVGISDADGRVKPSRQAKYRQVEEFLRLLDAAVDDALASGHLRKPSPERPLRVVDLGCGNAYLTFAAHRYLTGIRGIPTVVTGVDVKERSSTRNTDLAVGLGAAGSLVFARGDIGSFLPAEPPDVVLALHACDTATDDALARAVEWEAALVLAAPCCHHDLAAQLGAASAPAPYSLLTRHGILRERFADTLTDALRASLLRQLGYRVDVVEFVESRHTPRNTLLRAVRTGAPPSDEARAELDDLLVTWGVRPRLRELVDARLG
jgi:SAM-dependent methyltransferase